MAAILHRLAEGTPPDSHERRRVADLSAGNPDDARPVVFAGLATNIGRVRYTLNMLRWYRAFLASSCTEAKHPTDWTRGHIDKAYARRELTMMIHVAINRKAGRPDVVGRKDESDYLTRLHRDCRGVRDAVNRRATAWGLNGRRWETDEIQARYGHLLKEEID